MYTLFNEPSVSSRGALVVPQFNYLRGRLRENLDRVIGYYRASPMYYPSDHLLVQILQHLNVALDQDLLLYRDKVEDLTYQVSSTLGLTSALHVGAIPRKGVFYGNGSKEIVIAHDTKFPLTMVRENWEKLQPIRFLRHPKTDLNMDIPGGTQTSDETGLSVILVNIPMLACQWRQWRLRELRDNSENPRTMMQFLGLYPLPNALHSQIDVAFINRFKARFEGVDLPIVSDTHPFFLTNYENKMDQEIDKILVALDRRNITFEGILDALVPISGDTFQEVIAIPELTVTRQLSWAIVAARLPLMDYLLQWDNLTGGTRNRRDVNVISRSLRSLKSDRTMYQIGDMDVVRQLQQELDEIEKLLG